jgi:hypothetical protein
MRGSPRAWPLRAYIVVMLALATTFASASVATAVTAPVITSVVSPAGNSYLLQSRSYTCSAYVSNAPTSVQILYRPPLAGRTLTSAGGTLYRGTWTVAANDYMPGTQSGTSWLLNDIIVAASNSAGSTQVRLKGFVTVADLASYRATDGNFSYVSPTSSSFAGPATGIAPATYDGQLNTYNCLAYAVDVTTSWQWPWPNTNPTYTQVAAYMNKSGVYAARPGTKYTVASQSRIIGAKAIAYGTSGDVKHFAKVVAWDASGYPSRVRSKWGYWELCNSANYAPFASVYGSPMGYFK